MPHKDPEVRANYQKAYRDQNRELLRQRDREWKAKNAERIKAMKHDEYVKHREAYINRSKARWQSRKDEFNAQRRTPEFRAKKNEQRKEWWAGLPLWEKRFYSGLAQAYERYEGRIGDLNELKTFYQRVFTSDAAQCEYCSRVIKLEDVRIDHKQPYKLGGLHRADNLAVACRDCNTSKGSTPFNIWMAAIRKEVAWQ